MGSMVILFIYGPDIMSFLSQTGLSFLNGYDIMSLFSHTELPPVTEGVFVITYLLVLCSVFG